MKKLFNMRTKAKAPPPMGHNPPLSKEEKNFVAMMNDIFDRQTKEAMKNVPKVMKGEEIEMFDSKRWIFEVAQLTTDLRFRPFKRGGDLAVAELFRMQKTFGVAEWIEAPEVLEALNQENFEFARRINDTTANDLRAALSEGMKAGETVSQIKKRVEGVNANWKKGKRSMMIARTETARASTQGQIQAWKQSGIVTEKKWSAAGDACPFCAEMNGKIISIESSFFGEGDSLSADVGGGRTGTMKMGYGEVSGPPLHPNCRCSIVAHIVVDQAPEFIRPPDSMMRPKPAEVKPMSSVKEMIHKYPGLKKVKVIETPSFEDSMLGRYDGKGIIYLNKKEAQVPFRKIADAKDGTPPFNRFRGKEATLTHEYAHVLDYELGGGVGEGIKISDSAKWKKGFDKYLISYLDHPRGGQVISRYSRSNQAELFAEVVTAYTKDPVWLREINPDMFDLVESTLKGAP